MPNKWICCCFLSKRWHKWHITLWQLSAKVSWYAYWPTCIAKERWILHIHVFCLILHFLNIYSILQFNVLTNHFLSQSSKLRWVELHCPLQTCPLKKENHLHVTSLIFHIQFSNLLIYSIRQLRSVMWMGSDTTSKTLHQTLVFLHQILVSHLH